MSQLMARYGLPKEHSLFLNLEDPRLANLLHWETLDQIVEAFDAQIGRPGVYFFDEIQIVDGWEKWLRTQLDNPRGRRFVISGSNAQMLSGELGTTLTGRYIAAELFPFDFDEFVRARPEATLFEYLKAGGFPEPMKTPDGDLLLRQYFLDIIERDVRERVGARSSLPLRQLVQMVYESAGSELSHRRLAGALGVSADTVATYLEATEAAYLVFSCPYFDWSARKRLVRNTKFYPIDTGLRRVSVTKTGADKGKMLECATFLRLRREHKNVFYWRGKGEVDFVVEENRTLTPIQVTWDEPSERHMRALDDFYSTFQNTNEAVFVTKDNFASLGLTSNDGR